MYTGDSNEEKALVIEEVTCRVLAAVDGRCRPGGLTLEILINEAVRQERLRLKTEKPSRERDSQRRFWEKTAREFHRVPDAGRREILARIARLYVEEIHATFDPKLYGFASRVLSAFMKLLLNRFSPSGVLSSVGGRLSLEENLVVSGPVGHIRGLAETATLILVPTHVSNLDSIAIGLGLCRNQLPPFTYGAGLNLFGNPVLSYFMNRVGAYKVDRRKKNSIYKDTLKQYATLSLEQGHHNLFFPGGTRNRRGDVERHLKLGLLGCGLSAYVSNLRRGAARPDLFVVPATLSYGLVLEAKSLIEDQLREEGQNRFIQVRNDFSRPMRMLRFWKNLQSLQSKVHLHFGEPLDLFGNPVDADGISRDRHGRAVDRVKYVEVGGTPAPSPQRDREYTRELGSAIAAAYLRHNTALCTHAAAFAAFAALQAAYPESDLYRFLRNTGPECSVPLGSVLTRLEALLRELRALEAAGGIRLESALARRPPSEVWDAALSHFRSFHDQEVLRCEGEKVFSQDLKLLYYYRNRLDHYPPLARA